MPVVGHDGALGPRAFLIAARSRCEVTGGPGVLRMPPTGEIR
jgi:hypothetical protein